MRNYTVWIVSQVVFVLLCAISFTPLVIPDNIVTPRFIGFPRTLWAGFFVAFLIFVDIVIASWASQPKSRSGEK